MLNQEIFPKEIDPLKAAEQAKVFTAALPLTDFERFTSLIVHPTGNVQIHLQFVEPRGGRIKAQLMLTAEVNVTCERCQHPLPCKIEETLALQLVKTTKDIENLALGVSPMEVNATGKLELHTLIEDELILALPPFPVHPEKKDCSLGENQAYYASPEEEQSLSYQPFANLKELANLKEKK
jgi:uncharacterized protein